MAGAGIAVNERLFCVQCHRLTRHFYGENVDHPEWGQMSDANGHESEERWRAELLAKLDGHFSAARTRVDIAYRQHFASLRAVLARHWQYRRDVPADLLAMPRGVWHALKRGRHPVSRPLTGKEQAVADIMANEVLDLPGLQQLLLAQLRRHPDYHRQDFEELKSLLAPYDSEQAAQRLQQAVAQWGQRHDSSRELLLFLGLGLLGRGLSDKILFGSASILGVSAASSVYISQQSVLSAMWASWFGVPGWVAVSGAVGGLAVVVAATPLLSPFIEYGFNRYGTRRRLLAMIDGVHQELRAPVSERLLQFGGYLQFIPDIIQLLKHLK